MGWLIALGILTALAILPLGVSAQYDSGGALVRLILGPVKLILYPRPHSPPKKEKKPKEKKQEEKTGEKITEEKMCYLF